MESKTFKASAAAHIRNIFLGTVAVTFVLAILFTMVAGEPLAAFALIQYVAVGMAIREYLTSATVTVRADGILYKRGKISRTMTYETYYFSGSSTGLVAEDRRSSRTETLKCGGIDQKDMRAMAELISRRQSEYFRRRSSSGEYKSGTIPNPAANPTAKSAAKAAAESAAEASRRNPYSKQYQGERKKPAEPVKAVPPQSEAEQLSWMSAPSMKKSEPKPDGKPESKPAAVGEAAAAFAGTIPADYNKLPEIEPVQLPKKPDAQAPAPKVQRDEAFTKLEFRYSKRDIVERCERWNALAVLWCMFAAVAAFLAWYLAVGMFTGGALTAALVITVIATAAAVIIVQTSSVRTRGIFAKLEITDKYLIIDNKRWRFSDMSSMYITPPANEVGTRTMAFTIDGKRQVYHLGHSRRTVDKRDIFAFPRYAELCAALRKRGFQC